MENGVIVLGGGYAVGWGSLALINAVLAQSKNRNGLVWFLASLVVGPLVTLVLAFLEKIPKEN